MGREYSTEDLRRKLFESDEPFFLLDVLPHEAYAHRHLPGAINLPLERLEEAIASVVADRDAEVVAYCASPT